MKMGYITFNKNIFDKFSNVRSQRADNEGFLEKDFIGEIEQKGIYLERILIGKFLEFQAEYNNKKFLLKLKLFIFYRKLDQNNSLALPLILFFLDDNLLFTLNGDEEKLKDIKIISLNNNTYLKNKILIDNKGNENLNNDSYKLDFSNFQTLIKMIIDLFFYLNEKDDEVINKIEIFKNEDVKVEEANYVGIGILFFTIINYLISNLENELKNINEFLESQDIYNIQLVSTENYTDLIKNLSDINNKIVKFNQELKNLILINHKMELLKHIYKNIRNIIKDDEFQKMEEKIQYLSKIKNIHENEHSLIGDNLILKLNLELNRLNKVQKQLNEEMLDIEKISNSTFLSIDILVLIASIISIAFFIFEILKIFNFIDFINNYNNILYLFYYVLPIVGIIILFFILYNLLLNSRRLEHPFFKYLFFPNDPYLIIKKLEYLDKKHKNEKEEIKKFKEKYLKEIQDVNDNIKDDINDKLYASFTKIENKIDNKYLNKTNKLHKKLKKVTGVISDGR
jgi:hypothetical protein